MSGQETSKNNINRYLKERVLLLDGSMGVMIQRRQLAEERFRGLRFRSHKLPLKGNNDILCLSAPDVVSDIHRQYLEAGADIIETNTFNATSLSQREYGTEQLVKEINLAGARLARIEADRYSTPDRKRFVAGSIGPTGYSASLSPDVNDPAARNVDFDTLSDSFYEQAGALIDGGVDMLLIETTFDALNAKAAIDGARRAMDERNVDIPVIVSATVSDSSGRLLSGHTPDAFLSTIDYARPLAVGFNCSAGPSGLASHLRRLASISPYATVFYPNAGLPDTMGRYIETPERFVEAIIPLLKDGVLNIVGGCCGTTPDHISALSDAISQYGIPRQPGKGNISWLAGIEIFDDNRGFINVGERCNVAGSRKFLRLIKEKAYDEAIAIAHKQVADGAMILDINMDDGLLDTSVEMEHFLRQLASEPEVTKVPWMIDSSDFNVISTALKNIPGRAIVNSISLKHGEEEFLRQARIINRMGAAVVVMAFDEHGQATSYERKIEICGRAYRLLVENVGMNPRDIVFDPNILTIATGIPDHDRYALDFIKAVKWIHENLPGAKTSGGISNLSFAFRGNNYLRQAMHAVFLYHAINAGLSMAIMDPGAKVTYDAIPPQLLELIEDAILCRREDAAERLITESVSFISESGTEAPDGFVKTERDVDTRLSDALVRGDESTLATDIEEAITLHGSANAVVEGPLMSGMERVGNLFECGKMFLPQVVKSARTMHRAVDILRPQLEADRPVGSRKGLFMIATVKGDVHDIGKNIAGVILRCNNFEVVDLGVQVEASVIVSEALRLRPDFIGLSGLISPSLDEMVIVAEALKNAGITVPLLVGGAATSELHTALLIAPAYGDGVVVRVSDASRNPVVASRLINDRDNTIAEIKGAQELLRKTYQGAQVTDKKKTIPAFDYNDDPVKSPSFKGVREIKDVNVADVRQFINWTYFFNCWRVTSKDEVASQLRADAEILLDEIEKLGATMNCSVGFYDAYPEGDNIVISDITIPTPRQHATDSRDKCLSLADFVAPKEFGDHVGCFAVTIGKTLRDMISDDNRGDSYYHLLLQSICDRLAEATSEWLHYNVRTSLWGYAPDEPLDLKSIKQGKYQGIRPAIGYPSLPDQTLMHKLAQLLDMKAIGINVTENGALSPASSVAGFYIRSRYARYFTL